MKKYNREDFTILKNGRQDSQDSVSAAIEPFIKARRSGKLAFIAGAGVSRNHPANRPLSSEIIWSLVEAFYNLSVVSKRHWKKFTVCRRASKVRFESLIQIVAETTGSLSFLKILKGGKPNALHLMLARALLDGCPVLTTNFDQLIERVTNKKEKITTLKNTPDFKSWRRRSPRGVLAKLHGSLDDINSLCATLRQIGLLGPAFMWDPPRGEYLSKIRRDYPVMVIGYSGFDDSDIVPRLRITESKKPLIWILHSNCNIRLATSYDILHIAKAPGLAEFLKQSEAIVLVGNTQEACKLIDGKITTSFVVSQNKMHDSLPSKLVYHMKRTTAPFLADFVIARLFFEAGHKSASRNLFKNIRSELKDSRPGLAARCLTNEATVATDLGEWATAGKLLDRALPKLKRWADEKSFINACINRALVHRHTGHHTQGVEIFKMLIKQLKKLSEFRIEYARCLVNLADFLFEKEEFDKSLKLLKRSRREFKKVGEHSGMGMVFGVFGKLLFAQGKFDDAMALLHMALWHYEVAWDHAGKAKIFNNLGTVQKNLRLLDAAVASFNKAREIGEKINDIEAIVVSEMGMISVNLAMGKLNAAIRRSKECIRKAFKLGLISLAQQTKGNLGLALLDSGRIPEALKIFKEILPFIIKNGPTIHEALTLRNIGECHMKLGHISEAREFLINAENLYFELNREKEAHEVKALRNKNSQNLKSF